MKTFRVSARNLVGLGFTLVAATALFWLLWSYPALVFVAPFLILWGLSRIRR